MNQLQKRRIAIATGAAALLAIGAVVQPSAQVEILTHDLTDTAPHKVRAAVNTGVLAVSVLYTWTDDIRR